MPTTMRKTCSNSLSKNSTLRLSSRIIQEMNNQKGIKSKAIKSSAKPDFPCTEKEKCDRNQAFFIASTRVRLFMIRKFDINISCVRFITQNFWMARAVMRSFDSTPAFEKKWTMAQINSKKKANFVDYFARIAQGKPKGESAWNNTLKHLQDFTSGRIQFSAVTDDWLETFKTYLVTKDSQNTAHTYFSKIKAALKQAVKDKIIVSKPCNVVSHIKRQDTERTFLELGKSRNWRNHLVETMRLRGRFCSLVSQGWGSPTLEPYNGNKSKGTPSNSDRKRPKVLSICTCQRWPSKSWPSGQIPKSFSCKNTNIFNIPSQSQLGRVLKQWCKDAGIDKRVSFHTARHMFATLALTQGVDLYTVSKLLGHKTIQATQIYAKIVDEKKKAAMESLPMIEWENNSAENDLWNWKESLR